ncbi:hypothetical protein AAFC00_006421 [Neodothiora populina]|uniref:NAD(P)-binding protein n=1 Tax=Neodothiora populina TaxID=2781224 RepID=A0ABR3P5F0_9PEZI
MSDRASLSARSIPFMNLSDGTSASATAPPPPLLSRDPRERALERFAVKGTTVITGGAGTLALSAARAVLEHGAVKLALLDLLSTLETCGDAAIRRLQTDFPSADIKSIPVDVTDVEGVNHAFSTIVKHFETIDNLLCFAGIVGCVHALEMTPAQWRRTLDVNTTGSFLCAQAAAKHMVNQTPPGGSIVFTASISGHRVNFPQPQVAYNVSKAAIIALKSSLAAEWAVHGIRVNSLSPGYMDTILNEGEGLEEARGVWARHNPMGRMGAVGELDGVVVLLCSRAGSYITGADYLVDGGSTVF